jgi:N-acetylglucosamine-6-phosphate deacetylase
MNIPGYIDLQVNGLKGVDFSSPALTGDAFTFACAELRKNQTIGFLPTIITAPDDLLARNLSLMTAALRHADVARSVLGFHLEGPFISSADGARGAHNIDWVRAPDLAWLERCQAWADGRLRMITVAADVPGITDVIRAARQMGIVVSLGHQLANAAQLNAAAAAGATALTHLGNGLPHQIHRFDNPLWPALAHDGLTAMIIADGQHLPASLIKVILRAKGVARVVLTSDASPLALMPPGNYTALGNPVTIDTHGRLYNPETGYLVGSSATLCECVQWLRAQQLLTEAELEQVAYHNPLRLIGLEP